MDFDKGSPAYPDGTPATPVTNDGSELGIGITGVAGPTGGTPEKPVGLIYIALSDGTRTWVRRMTPPGRVHGRGWLRDRAAGTALDMVRRYLSDLPLEPVQSAGSATTL